MLCDTSDISVIITLSKRCPWWRWVIYVHSLTKVVKIVWYSAAHNFAISPKLNSVPNRFRRVWEIKLWSLYWVKPIPRIPLHVRLYREIKLGEYDVPCKIPLISMRKIEKCNPFSNQIFCTTWRESFWQAFEKNLKQGTKELFQKASKPKNKKRRVSKKAVISKKKRPRKRDVFDS